MSVGNDDMNLGLALSYSNLCIRTRSNNNSGAGVNADSKVDMAFVVSGPLSELVWSPHNGLGLKCAECSLVDKKPSLLWDVGPSSVVHSPSQSVKARETRDDKPIDEENVIMSQVAFCVDNEVGDTASLANSYRGSSGHGFGSSHECSLGAGEKMEEMKTLEAVPGEQFRHKQEYIRENQEKCLCSSKNVQVDGRAETSENNADHETGRETDFLPPGINESRPEMVIPEPLSRKCYGETATDRGGRNEGVSSGSYRLGSEVALLSEIHVVKHCEAGDRPMSEFPSPGSRDKQIDLVCKDVSKNQLKKHSSTSDLPLEKLEFTAENDLHLLVCKDSCEHDEERPQVDKSRLLEASPNNSRVLRYQRKGKGKAISDGDTNEIMSKDNSHESVESCNSAPFLPKVHKRGNFEQQLIVGSKRRKKQVQDSPASNSLVGQDSSFLNWISNMVKGMVKSHQDEGPCLSLSLAHPNHGHESHDSGKIITCNKNHDSGTSNMGFQTIFQSLYCLNPKLQETITSKDKYSAAESGELLLAGKTCVADVTPIASRRKSDKSCKQFLLSNEKFDKSTFRNGEGLSVQPLNLSANIFTAREASMLKFTENKTSSRLAHSKSTNEVCASDSSLSKRKTYNTENNHSDPQYDGKSIQKMGLGSLWITRFSPKIPSPVSHLDLCNQNTRGALECATDCTRLVPRPQNCADFTLEQKSSEAREYPTEGPVSVVGKELQNHAPSMEASFGFRRISGHNCQSYMYEPNNILRPPKLHCLEALTSVFSRRLDALKHVIKLDANDDDRTCKITTCFFCGISGHDLHGCSEISETEKEDLLKNITSYIGAEESPCFCIRCFQNDHWAIICPLASSRREQQSKHGDSLIKQQSSSKVQYYMGNKRQTSMLETNESRPQVAGEHTNCNGKKPRIETDPNMKPVWNGEIKSDRRNMSVEEDQKNFAQNSGENELKENQITPFFKSASKQIPDVPEGMFDAIRRLRLSRTYILKLMNSHTSLMLLDGFFLRLRVGKWEEGLRGTGYYVACITGVERENLPKSSKISISANVMGIKCMVECQCISNHDFLEDELMAWWYTTSRSGGKIPSVMDMKLKLKDREEMGM